MTLIDVHRSMMLKVQQGLHLNQTLKRRRPSCKDAKTGWFEDSASRVVGGRDKDTGCERRIYYIQSGAWCPSAMHATDELGKRFSALMRFCACAKEVNDRV